MNNYKRLLRRILLILMILLASFGVGLVGGLPLPISHKRDDKTEIENEMVDVDDEVKK